MRPARRGARRLARAVHRRFRGRPGSEHIATESAVRGLVRALRRARPRRVLELGAGIGTLTEAAIRVLERLHGPDGYTLVATESDPFCLEQLDRNLADRRGCLRVVADPGALPADAGPFDFVIADGGEQDDPRPFRDLARGATVFIEGDRRPQAATLEAAIAGRPFARADVRILRRRTLADGRRVWDGGYRLYRLEPTPRWRLRLAALDLRTKVVHRLRPLLAAALGR